MPAFDAALGIVFLVLGAVFVLASRRPVWNALETHAVRLDPIRRYVKGKFPRFHARSNVAIRHIMRWFGVIAMLVGALSLTPVLMSR